MKKTDIWGQKYNFSPEAQREKYKKRKNAGIKAFFIKIMSTFAAQNEPTI